MHLNHQKLPTYGLSRAAQVHQRNPWILHTIIIERSALARCTVLIIRNKNTLQTFCSATFAPFLSCSFIFLFFYDDAMRGTTTQGQPHPTSQPTTTRDTPRDTAPHNNKKDTHTRTRTCTCICMCMCTCRCSCTCQCHFGLNSHEETQSGTRTFHDVYCSKLLTPPQCLNVSFLKQMQT